MIGIYKITNNINNKIYIGQSIDLLERWKSHKRKFKNGKYQIHKAMIKYGVENFSFEIIEECNKEKLNEKEIYWISFYDSYKEGYNATPGGYSNGMSEETKKKISKSLRNKNNDGLNQKERRLANRKYDIKDLKKWKTENFGIKIICVETGEKFNSIIEAHEKYKINFSNISQVVAGKRKTAGGYHWEKIK